MPTAHAQQKPGFATPPSVASARGSSAPVDDSSRLRALDALRGFAVLGILLVNVQSFAMPGAAYMNPTAYGDLTGANLGVWALTHTLFDQKFISIFSMLFGAGILLFADRAEAAGRKPWRLHYRRMGWLLMIGLAHAHLIWYGDILVSYALCGMILYPLRKRGARTLLVLGVVWIAIGSAVMLAMGASMAFWSPDAVESFTRGSWQPTAEMIAREVATYRSGWLDQMPLRSRAALSLETMLFLIVFFWRVGGLVLIGMGLHKLGVFAGTARRGVYVAMVIAALLIGIPTVAYGAWRNFATGWDVRYSFFFGSQFNNWASLIVALGWVGALHLLVRSGMLMTLVRRLEAVGRTALTQYILQSVIATLVFYGHGLGLFGQVDRVWQVVIVAAIWSLQLLVAPALVRRLHFGPLEWGWRSLTYGRRQPFVREVTA